MRLFAIFLMLTLAACSDLDQHARQAAKSMNLDMTTKLDHSSDPAGPDIDKNGIRDDIDLWISKQEFISDQVSVTKAYARVLQQTMVTKTKDREQARMIANKNGRAMECLFFVFNNENNFIGLSSILEQSTFNTRERLLQQDRFNSMLDGMVFTSTPPSMLSREQCL